MYKIEINENIKVQLADRFGTYLDDKAIEIIGIEIKNQEYNLIELKQKINEDIKSIAERQMEKFISDNIENQDIFSNKEDSIYLVDHEIKIKKVDRLYIDFDFKKLKENILIASINRVEIYVNLLDWTYKTHTKKRIGTTFNYRAIETENLTRFIYNNYRDKDALLLKRQLDLGSANPVFYECKKINDFLKDKKTIKMIINGKEILIKDLFIGRHFAIEDMNLVFSKYSNKIDKPTEVTLKHARKEIKFTVYPRMDNN